MKRICKVILAITLVMVTIISMTAVSVYAVNSKPPNAPTNINIQNSGTGFYISWNKSAGAAKYRIYYKTKETEWAYKDSNSNSVSLNDLLFGNLYYIQVQSIGSNNAKGGFTKVNTMTHVRTTKLTSTVYNSNGTVTVGWNAADGANGYAVAKIKAGDKKYTYYYTSETSLKDTDIEGGVIYYYQIRPYFTNGKSAAYAPWSNTKSLTTLFRPTITSINTFDTFMNINWNAIFGAKGYKIAFKRSTDKAWNFRTTSSRYYNVPNPTQGATYYVQVCAINGNLAGPYSTVNNHEIKKKDPHEGQTYYKAGDIINVYHPAENELVWVVDEPAHQETVTEEKSVYHYRICQGCGAVGDGWTAEQIKEHDVGYHGIDYGELLPFPKPKSGYVTENVDTILNVAEKGHYEVQVITEAWDEQVEIKEAGWYKTINHPAETVQAKVVDKAAYYYEEPVYEYVYKQLCWGCDAIVGNDVMNSSERAQHMSNHHQNGEISGYRQVKLKVLTDTNTINIPEELHYETVVMKTAWNEKILVERA